jgi:hypothetical protein
MMETAANPAATAPVTEARKDPALGGKPQAVSQVANPTRSQASNQPASQASSQVPSQVQSQVQSQVANLATARQDMPATTATAKAPTSEPVPEVRAARADFGVDLGGANSVDGLRGLWQGLLKADAALLSPLRPIIAIRERSNGLGMQLRLVAGPLADAAAAAKICAALVENSRSCETTVFDGQRLALRSEPEPAPRAAPAARPPQPRKHVTVRPAHSDERAPEPPAPTPPPAPAASSSSLLPEFLRSR